MNRDVCEHFSPVDLPCDKCMAEPVDPVAWRWGYRSVTTGEMDWRGYVEIPAHPNLRSPAIIMEPLYTAPPQRKPLSVADLQEALVYANLIDRDAIDDPEGYDEGSTVAQIDVLHRMLIT